MRAAEVCYNNHKAGMLVEHSSQRFTFLYYKAYVNSALPAISLTLPKQESAYESPHLFPFFFSLLSEGENKRVQCRHHHVDENDHFGLLLATAGSNTIGAVTVHELKPSATQP